MLKHLVDLGYLEAADLENTERIVIDRLRSLAQVHAAAGRPEKAIEQYQLVLQKAPEDRGAKLAMAWALLSLGRLAECERIMDEVLADERDTPRAHLIKAMVAFAQGKTDASLMHLKTVELADPSLPGLHRQLGLVYLRRGRLRDAARAFRKAIELDPDDAEAHDGLGVVHRRGGRPAEAVYEHMLSVALLHYRPQTHIHLGMALAETGQFDWASRAFHVAQEMDPHNPLPRRCLAELAKKNLSG
jgi:Flp pilus assembly protein TadD